MPLLAVLLYSGSKDGKRLWRVIRIFTESALQASPWGTLRKHEGTDDGRQKQRKSED